MNISKFFRSNYIYHNNNFKLLYLNENNNYLTNVIQINDKLNNNIENIGLSWYLKINLRIHTKLLTSTLSSAEFETIYSNIPILNCKLVLCQNR